MRRVVWWAWAGLLAHAIARAEDVRVTYLLEDRPLRGVVGDEQLANNSGDVYFRTGSGMPLQVTVDSPFTFEPTGLQAWFESTDCTGVPLFPPLEAHALFVYAAGFRDGRVYCAPPTGAAMTTRSYAVYEPAAYCAQGATFTPPDVCCHGDQPPGTAVLAPIESIDLSGFVPPFHVELAP